MIQLRSAACQRIIDSDNLGGLLKGVQKMETGAAQTSLIALLAKLALAFIKTGMFTFGSGYAMLGQMQREIVERYAWLTAEQFADVVSIAEVTPGPITVNMATFVGYRVAGILGSVVATLGLIVGPMISIILVAMFYAKFRNNPLVDAAFRGLRPTVLALILVAILKLAKTAFGGVWDVALFAAALACLYFVKVSPILVALGGLVVGIIIYH